MTPLQEQMILKIARNEMNTAKGHPYTAMETNTWADEIIESDEDKVVFASLVKDGLARHSHKALCADVCLTEIGFSAYMGMEPALTVAG